MRLFANIQIQKAERNKGDDFLIIEANQKEKRSWVEISINQIIENYRIYKGQCVPGTEIMAVIKADAYGHGDVKVATALENEGVHLFAVSNIDEAVGLRKSGIKGEILILGYTSPTLADKLFEYDIIQTLVSEEYADELAKQNIKVKCQFAIDTGMNRIGLDSDNPDECDKIIRRYCRELSVNGIFTHLCVADTDTESCHRFTEQQISKFKAVVSRVRDLKLPYVHYCNSAGGLAYPDLSLEPKKKIVRLGIILYGLKPDYGNTLPDGIKPALTWKSTVSMVKELRKGETVGYGRTFKAENDMRVATVTTGYADGYNRLLSNKGFVMLNGKKASIIGRVCMDQFMVDVTDIPEVSMGSVAVLLGTDRDTSYTADDMAESIGTIGYEVVCDISNRVQRYYI